MQPLTVLSLAACAFTAATSAPSSPSKPEQFHLAWTSQADEMWVSWVTLGPTPGGGYRSRCQYSTKAPLSAYYRTVPAVTATYRDGGPPSCQDCVAWNGTAHRARLTGLPPATRVYYRCGDDDARGGFGATAAFVSRPADTVTRVTTTFGAAGDVGSYAASRRVLASMLSERDGDMGGLDFVHQIGDIAYAGGNQSLWDVYFSVFEPLFSGTPALLTPGNHDGEWRYGNDYTRPDGGESGVSYATRLAGPGADVSFNSVHTGPMSSTAFYWSTDHGMVHLIGMSGVHEFHPGSKQYRWLEADLARANSRRGRHARPWIVLTNHYPMYCTLGDCFCNYTVGATCENPAHPNASRGVLEVTADFLRRPLEPLLLKYGVDLVLTGHEHAYERTLPVADLKPAVPMPVPALRGGNATSHFVDPTAPIHVMAGTGGGSPDTDWRNPPDAWSASRSDTSATVDSPFGWLKLRFEHDAARASSTATIQFLHVDDTSGRSTVFDSFSVTKTGIK